MPIGSAVWKRSRSIGNSDDEARPFHRGYPAQRYTVSPAGCAGAGRGAARSAFAAVAERRRGRSRHLALHCGAPATAPAAHMATHRTHGAHARRDHRAIRHSARARCRRGAAHRHAGRPHPPRTRATAAAVAAGRDPGRVRRAADAGGLHTFSAHLRSAVGTAERCLQRHARPQQRERGAPSFVALGAPFRYSVTREPHDHRWLFALDLPAELPAGARASEEFQLYAPQAVRERQRYTLTSYPDYRTVGMSKDERRRTLQLPAEGSPRARALAADWRAHAPSAADVVQAALRMYREQNFVYTLTPPRVDGDFVDGFLFGTRRGFCE